MTPPVRLAVGGLLHETNTYASGLTPLERFHRASGDALERLLAGSQHPVAGLIAAARARGAEVAVTFGAEATPSATIAAAAYQELKRQLLDGLRAALPLDGVLLALHGAGVAEGVDDIEGDVLDAVRALVGPGVPVAVLYDLHGNLSERMCRAADFTLPCRLYPHTDYGMRAQEAVDLLLRRLRGEVRPVTALRRLPLLLALTSTDPGFAPARANALCAGIARRPGVLDCAWFHGFAHADVPTAGAAVVCTTDGDAALAQRSADELALWIWQRREDFRPPLLAPAEGVARALALPEGTVVLNESADNPGGGAPGDGTHLLRALIDAAPAPGTCCFGMLNDAETVQQAIAAGVGRSLRVRLGGKLGPLQGAPIEAEARVRALTDGRFTNRAGSMLAGVAFDVGPSARLEIAGIDVLVISRPEQVFDPEPFLLHGIDVARRRLVGLKSSNHFRAGFRGLPIVTVESAGLSSADVATLPRRRLAAPAWPLSDAAEFSLP